MKRFGSGLIVSLVLLCLVPALAAQGSAAENIAVAKPLRVLAGHDKHLIAWLKEKHDLLLGRAEELEGAIIANRRKCGSVSERDTALIAECRSENAALNVKWNNYETERASYERQRHLIMLLDQYWSTTNGLIFTGQAFLAQAAALGGDALREYSFILSVVGGGATALTSAAAGPLPTVKLWIAAAEIALVASLTWIVVNFPDCHYSDDQLKTSCENFHVFHDRLKKTADEIDRNYSRAELLQLGR